MGREYRERVWQNKGLKGGRLLVMLALADHADANGNCWPGMALLMEKTRLTDRQLRRVLNNLDADGLISIEERAIGRGKRPHYKLFPQKKADILPAFQSETVEDKAGKSGHFEHRKADISDNKSGHFVQEKADILDRKADISNAIPSHARIEPLEPKEEPIRGSARSPTGLSRITYFDSRKFVNGKIPAGTGSTPMEVFHEVHAVTDDRHMLGTIALQTVTEAVTDLVLWREVVRTWALRGNKPTNVEGQLDWYRNPSRFRKEHHGTHNGRTPTNYERPPSAEFSQREWNEYLATKPGDDIPF